MILPGEMGGAQCPRHTRPPQCLLFKRMAKVSGLLSNAALKYAGLMCSPSAERAFLVFGLRLNHKYIHKQIRRTTLNLSVSAVFHPVSGEGRGSKEIQTGTCGSCVEMHGEGSHYLRCTHPGPAGSLADADTGTALGRHPEPPTAAGAPHLSPRGRLTLALSSCPRSQPRVR